MNDPAKTGGRLIRLLASKGYIQLAYHYTPPKALLLLTKLTRDGVTANDFLSWRAQDKAGNWFGAENTDLIDLNEKLLAYNFPPLVFRIQSKVGEFKARELRENFGRKVDLK